MIFTVSLLGTQDNRDSVENKPARLLVVSLGKTLSGMPPFLCGRQMVGPSSLPVVVALVKLKTCKPSVSANAMWPVCTSSCIKLTTNSSNDEELRIVNYVLLPLKRLFTLSGFYIEACTENHGRDKKPLTCYEGVFIQYLYLMAFFKKIISSSH